MLDHVSRCDLLPDGEYWCHEHQAPERFASVRVSRLLRRAWSYKQTPTKDPEEALLKRTKRAFRSLGPGSLHKSTGSSSLPLSDPAMIQAHCGLVTVEHLAPGYPELAGTPVYELGTGNQHKSTYLPSSFLSEPTMKQRLNGLVTEGHHAPEHPEFDGTEAVDQVYELGPGSRHKSTCPSCSFLFDTAIEQGLNGHGTEGHFAPDPGVFDYELFAATGTCADLYLTVSPVELMAADPTAIPPRQPNDNSLLFGNNSPQSSSPVSQICSPSSSTSSDQKSRDINNHDVSHTIRSLDSLQSTCSVCTSTRPFRRSSLEFRQPATEQQIERSGSYSHHFAVPPWMSSVPDFRPLAPRHFDESIAMEQNDPTITSLSQSRLEDEYAHLAEEFLQPSLLPRVDGCTTLNPLSNATSEIGPSTLYPPDLQVTMAEAYQGKPASFEETPETFYPIQCFDKTLSQDQEAFTSIIAGTEKRLTAGELHSLAEVEIDLRSGAEVKSSAV